MEISIEYSIRKNTVNTQINRVQRTFSAHPIAMALQNIESLPQ